MIVFYNKSCFAMTYYIQALLLVFAAPICKRRIKNALSTQNLIFMIEDFFHNEHYNIYRVEIKM